MKRGFVLAVAAGLLSLSAGSCLAQERPPKLNVTGCQQQWPREALRYELEGKANLKFDLDRDGRAINTSVTRSSGWGLLDDASISTVPGRASSITSRRRATCTDD